MIKEEIVDKGHLILSFQDAGPIEATELAHFLFLYRGAYAAALSMEQTITMDQLLTDNTIFMDQLTDNLNGLDVTAIDALFSRDLGTNAPVPERIGRESPLEIVIADIMVALTLAVILSGGKVKFDVKIAKIEAALPPIGEGIRRLQEALTKAPKAQLGYGIRAKRIKLTKQEFNELMKFDPASEKHGGFQRLLIGMQYKINHLARELELSDHDMNMILRHGRNPEKGGWQSSIKKVFGSHFDFGAA
jgi:hypothetical protein